MSDGCAMQARQCSLFAKTHRCPLGAGLGLRLVVGVADDTLERLAVLRGRLLEGLLQLLTMLDLGPR